MKEHYTVFSTGVQKLSEKGIEYSTAALFEVITRIIIGSITPGMINSKEDSPPYRWKPFQQGSLPLMDKDIFYQITNQYYHFKVSYLIYTVILFAHDVAQQFRSHRSC